MVIVVVGTGARRDDNLGICPNRMVLGHRGYEDMCLAAFIGDPLVDAMGAAVEKTRGCLMAERWIGPASVPAKRDRGLE
jgi:hypothetical protein